MQQLSKEEVAKLLQFVKTKHVRFIDVQFEIVDHLATQIEELQTEDESLSFEKALSIVYKRYPITGFLKLVENRTAAMNQYWRMVYRKYLLAYFKLPKLILTVLLFVSFISLFQSINFVVVFSIMTVLSFIPMIKTYSLRDKKRELLVIDSFVSIYGTGCISFAIIMNYVYVSDWVSDSLTLIITSALASVFTILYPAYLFYFPEKLKQDLHKKYDHLNISLR